jgi:hypothetical protein
MRATVDHNTSIFKHIREGREEARWTCWFATVLYMPAIAPTVGHA